MASGAPLHGQGAPAAGVWRSGGLGVAVSACGAAHPAAVGPRVEARVAPAWPLEARRAASSVPCGAGDSSGGRLGGAWHTPYRLASCAARIRWTWAAEPHVRSRGAPASSIAVLSFAATYNWGRPRHHALGTPQCPPSPTGLQRVLWVAGRGRTPASVVVVATGGQRSAGAYVTLADVGRSLTQKRPPPPLGQGGGAG